MCSVIFESVRSSGERGRQLYGRVRVRVAMIGRSRKQAHDRHPIPKVHIRWLFVKIKARPLVTVVDYL